MTQPSDATLEHLRQLVGFDTTSALPNRPLIDHVANVLEGRAHNIEVVPDPEQEGKASLVVRFGPEVAGGIVISGHTDCVPVEGQAWRADPFAVIIEDGRAIGRGTTDMKGFLAAVLAAAPALADADLQRPVHLAFSHDEELGALSAGMLAAHLLPHDPVLAVIGEPTGMDVVVGHKGVRGFRATITGKAGHSSRPEQGANAAIAAARLVGFIDDLAADVRSSSRDDRFDPPYTTFGVGRIDAGRALNVIPEAAEILFEYRPVPADDSDELEQRIRAHVADVLLPGLRTTAPQADIAVHTFPPLPSMEPFDDKDARAVVAAIAPGSPQDRTAAFGTDGGHFAKAGIPTVILGPGNVDDAHTANESIALDQLEAAERMLDRVIAWATA